jgi:hypothetical protein
MYKSLIYKEWIKTQKAILLLLFVFLGIGIYSFMKITEAIRLLGMVNYWESIIQKDITLFPYFKYLALSGGVLLAITQYVPELQYKRLKLTLHLPLNETKILSIMLYYGFSVILLFILITLPALLFGLSIYFPAEIVWAAYYNMLPWFLAGLAAYLTTSWICLEPQWKQRVMNAIPGICAVSYFFIAAKSGAYQPFLPYLAGFIIIAFFFSFYSTIRFKEGVQ